MRIKLDKLADALAVSDIQTGYVDLEKGEIIVASSSITKEGNPDREDEERMDQSLRWEIDWHRYVALPNLGDYDFHEIFAQFIVSNPIGDVQRKKLLAAAAKHKHEPFYKRLLKEMNLSEAWEQFLHQYFCEVAKDWCEENDIEYEI